MQSEDNAPKLEVVSDDGDFVQLRLAETELRPDMIPENDPLIALLGERGYARAALLSLAGTEYVNSCGLALLLIWHKRFRDAGGKLVLHSISSPMMETLQILRMELVLHLAGDLPSAMEALRGETA